MHLSFQFPVVSILLFLAVWSLVAHGIDCVSFEMRMQLEAGRSVVVHHAAVATLLLLLLLRIVPLETHRPCLFRRLPPREDLGRPTVQPLQELTVSPLLRRARVEARRPRDNLLLLLVVGRDPARPAVGDGGKAGRARGQGRRHAVCLD